MDSTVPPSGAKFDRIADGLVNDEDLDQWLLEAAEDGGFITAYHRGDAQLDRDVDITNDVEFTNLLAVEGDADGDIDIDITDFNILSSNFDDSGVNSATHNWTTGDFDADGDVDITDFNVLAKNFAPSGYGSSVSVQIPEPTSFLLAALGLMSLRLLGGRPVRKGFVTRKRARRKSFVRLVIKRFQSC